MNCIIDSQNDKATTSSRVQTIYFDEMKNKSATEFCSLYNKSNLIGFLFFVTKKNNKIFVGRDKIILLYYR